MNYWVKNLVIEPFNNRDGYAINSVKSVASGLLQGGYSRKFFLLVLQVGLFLAAGGNPCRAAGGTGTQSRFNIIPIQSVIDCGVVMEWAFQSISRSNGAILAHQVHNASKSDAARNGVGAAAPLAGCRRFGHSERYIQAYHQGYSVLPGIPRLVFAPRLAVCGGRPGTFAFSGHQAGKTSTQN